MRRRTRIAVTVGSLFVVLVAAIIGACVSQNSESIQPDSVAAPSASAEVTRSNEAPDEYGLERTPAKTTPRTYSTGEKVALQEEHDSTVTKLLTEANEQEGQFEQYKMDVPASRDRGGVMHGGNTAGSSQLSRNMRGRDEAIQPASSPEPAGSRWGDGRVVENRNSAANVADATYLPPPQQSGGAAGGLKKDVGLGIAGTATPARTNKGKVEGYAPFQRAVKADAKLTFTSVGAADEIWVIGRPAADDTPQADDYPGSGSMLALLPIAPGPEVDRHVIEGDPRRVQESGELRRVPMPLKHTAVHAQVTGYISTVDVTQQFQNPFTQKIEAVYVFPLPQDAAVSEFVMTIGERKIRGIIREREEAKQIYEQAKAQGYNAALLTQERPNIFTQKVANIEPGKQIDVNIRYFNTLRYEDGWYSFVFPTVVGPRFNPAGSADPINAVARGSEPADAGKQVQYLRPNERSGHDISISVDIDAGVTVEEVKSLSHVIRHQGLGTANMSVALNDADRVPNKDFVLKFRVAGDRVKSNLMTWRGEDGVGYFTLMLYPPQDLSSLQRQAMEMVFVLDCSGSMNGRPMEQSKAAMLRALMHLRADDTFQVIRFSEKATALGAAPLPVTDETRDQAAEYVRKLQGSGGTQMIEGVKAALDFPHDRDRYRVVTFLTDGYIGNEAQILAAVQERVGDARVFSFGVGSSTNRYLLERMAKIGRGTAGFLGLNDSGAEIMDLYFERISHPAMTHIDVDWGTMKVSDVYPRKLPDLFVGRPVIITGKFTGDATAIKVNGRAGSQAIAMDIAPNADDEHKAVAKVWARMRIADLADQLTWDNANAKDLAGDIFGTAMEHGLMSAYTAFVAVDASQVTAGIGSKTVPVAVPVPDGVKYETTVAER
jgi:Ca-activated chloride channel family protein